MEIEEEDSPQKKTEKGRDGGGSAARAVMLNVGKKLTPEERRTTRTGTGRAGMPKKHGERRRMGEK